MRAGWQTFWKLRWPAAVPYLFVSMKVAIAASLVGAIVGELPTGAVAGLGARLLTGSYYGQTVQIWAALVAAAVHGRRARRASSAWSTASCSAAWEPARHESADDTRLLAGVGRRCRRDRRDVLPLIGSHPPVYLLGLGLEGAVVAFVVGLTALFATEPASPGRGIGMLFIGSLVGAVFTLLTLPRWPRSPRPPIERQRLRRQTAGSGPW